MTDQVELSDPMERDGQLTDLLDAIILWNDARKQQKVLQYDPDPIFHGLIDEYLLLIMRLSNLERVGWFRLFMVRVRYQFNSSQIPAWTDFEADDAFKELVCGLDGEKIESCGRKAELRADTVRIARQYGLDAAMLFKLSDGAMDPRVAS